MLLCQWLQEFGDSLKIVKIEADPCPYLMEQYKVCPFAEQQCIAVLCTRFSFCEDFIYQQFGSNESASFSRIHHQAYLGH